MSGDATSGPDLTHNKPPRPPRWIPLSIRMFLAILVLLGVGSALWIGLPAYRQHVSIQEIERAGGVIGTQPVGPSWLRGWLGEEQMKPFDKVVRVTSIYKQVDDESLVHLGWLSNLQVLDIENLPGLDIENAPVTDATMAHIERLTNLETLILDGMRISDDGLSRLAGMSSLRQLLIGNSSRISNAGLAHIQNLTGLENLQLQKTRVTDAGLAHLRKMVALRGLHLENTRITDEGLEYLKPLANLTHLSLDGTQVTDRGLVHLKGLTNLEQITLCNTDVTDAGVADLQRALPDLKIIH